MKSRISISSLILLSSILLAGSLRAQEIDLDSLLIREIEVENPTYMPVIGFGTGTMHYFGEVKNNYRTPLTGKMTSMQASPFCKRINSARPIFN